MMESSDTITSLRHISDIYPIIGDGRYQLLIIMAGCISTIPIGMQEFMLVFLAFNPGWQCEGSSNVCLYNGTVLSSDPHFNARCTMNRTDWKLVDTKGFSIVNEFDLFCDKSYWIYTSSSVFYLGNLIGALVSGWLSDRIGRTKVLLGNYIMVLLTGLITSFLPNLWLFEVIRMVTGICVPGTYMVMVVLSSEVVSEKFRPAAGIVYWIFYSGGVALLGVKAFYLHSWRKLLIYASVPYILNIVLLGFLPESFVWLHVQGKDEELKSAIKKIAKINKKKVPDNIVIKFTQPTDDADGAIVNLFSPFNRLITTLPMMLTWFSVGVVYFGVALAADDLTGNEYRDFVLLALVDIPAAFIAIISAMKLGRKKTAMFSVLVGGLCITAVGFFPEMSKDTNMIICRLVFAISAKFFCSVTFDVIVTWCTELYPTKLRSKANGIFNSCLIFGGMCAPWVSMCLHNLSKAAPFIVMGTGMIISSFLLIKIAETKGKRLPQRTNTTRAHHFEGDNTMKMQGAYINEVPTELSSA